MVAIPENVSSRPIPSFAFAWDCSIIRPAALPEEYDTRIPMSSIFYVPAKDLLVVAHGCTNCRAQQQACDRDLPKCSRCLRTGKECVPSNPGYVPLPGPKKNRTNASLSGSPGRSYFKMFPWILFIILFVVTSACSF